MSNNCFCHFNGYEVKDAEARKNINNLNTKIKNIEFVSIEDYGAKGDGVTDDTQSIKDCLNSGVTKIVFPSNKEVLITSPIEIPSHVKYIDFSNCHIKYAYEQPIESNTTPYIMDSCFIIKDNDNFIIENGVLEYIGGYDKGWISGIYLENCNNAILNHIEAKGFRRGGIDIESDADKTTRSKNILVENCYLHHNRCAGLFFGNTDKLTIFNNRLEYNGQEGDYGTGYGLAGNSLTTPTDTVVLCNHTKHNYRKGIDFHGGTNGKIINNIIDGDVLYGISISNRLDVDFGHWEISNNVLKNIVNNGVNSDYITSYGIWFGPLENQSQNFHTELIVENNKFLDFNQSNGGSVHIMQLYSNRFYDLVMKVADNVVKCKNVFNFINSVNEAVLEGYFSQILIENNHIEVESFSSIVIRLLARNFKLIKFTGNTIISKLDYTWENILARAWNGNIENIQIFVNNFIKIPGKIENFTPFNITGSCPEIIDNNLVV